jgi:pimeloyl-ACP methyl ester carboxylesterase
VAADAHVGVDAWTGVDGVALHTEVIGGEAPGREPIVMLHGLGVSATSLRPLAERLAGRRTAMCCDLPGFGLSASPRIWPTGEMAAVVGGLLDARGLERVVLLGHSFGCHVAALVAAARPERVAALVFLSPAFDPRAGGALAMMLRLTIDAPMDRRWSGAGCAATSAPVRGGCWRPCARRPASPSTTSSAASAARCSWCAGAGTC